MIKDLGIRDLGSNVRAERQSFSLLVFSFHEEEMEWARDLQICIFADYGMRTKSYVNPKIIMIIIRVNITFGPHSFPPFEF